MLGVLDVLPFLSVGRVTVPKGAVLLCYTDGLTEVFDEEEAEFGIEGACHAQPGRELPEVVPEAASQRHHEIRHALPHVVERTNRTERRRQVRGPYEIT